MYECIPSCCLIESTVWKKNWSLGVGPIFSSGSWNIGIFPARLLLSFSQQSPAFFLSFTYPSYQQRKQPTRQLVLGDFPLRLSSFSTSFFKKIFELFYLKVCRSASGNLFTWVYDKNLKWNRKQMKTFI